MGKALLAALAVLGAACARQQSFSDPIARLQVEPDAVTVDAFTRIPLRVTAVTRSGFHTDPGPVTFAVSGGSLDPQNRFIAAGVGEATVTARAAGFSATATLHVIPSGTVTVQVVDSASGLPIPQAALTVLAFHGGNVTTDSSGTASFSGLFSGGIGLSVAAPGYVPRSLFDVKVRQVLIPMRPAARTVPGAIRGTIDFTKAFGSANPPIGYVWMGVAGPSIQGDPLAIDLGALLGPDTPITLGGVTATAPSNVFVFGATEDYLADAPSGPAAAWAIGGQIADLTLAGGLGPDPATVVTLLLPQFDQVGLSNGLTVPPGQILEDTNLTLDQPRSHELDLAVPPRPVGDPGPLIFAAVTLGSAEGMALLGISSMDDTSSTGGTIFLPATEGEFAGRSFLVMVVAQSGGFVNPGAQRVASLVRGITGQGSVTLPPFIVPPTLPHCHLDLSTQTAFCPPSPGADFTVQTITTDAGEWDVATGPLNSGYRLPGVAGSGSWLIESVSLESLTYEALLTRGTSTNLSRYSDDANAAALSAVNLE